MKRITITILGVFLICFSFSCRKKDKDECPFCPKVNSLAPASGKKGDTILINGKNFSNILVENKVTFNGVLVNASGMISGNSTQLKVLVPAKCGTGPVEVKIDDELFSENGPTFTYQSETKISVFSGTSGTSGNSASGTAISGTRFKGPYQLAIDPLNNLYVLDTGNLKVTKLDVTTNLSTVLFDKTSQVSNPTSMTVDENSVVYASSFNGSNATIYRYTPGSSFPTFYASDPESGRKHVSLSSEGNGKFYIGRETTNLSLVLPDIQHYTPTNGFQDFTGGAGNVIFLKSGFIYQINSIVAMKIFQTEFSKYNIADTTETLLINNTGGLNMSRGLVVDDAGNSYISDTENNRILKCSPTGVVSVLISTGLKRPQGIVMDKLGNLYVADTGNNCIKKIIFD